MELLKKIVCNVSETLANTVFPKDSYIPIYIKKLISLFSRGWRYRNHFRTGFPS